jgi:uncharacterized membrane protein
MSLLDEKVAAGSSIGTSNEMVTRNAHYVAPPQDKDGKTWVRTSAIVLAEAQTLYALWRDIESAPKWQEQLKEVVKTGPNTSRWVMVKDDKTLTGIRRSWRMNLESASHGVRPVETSMRRAK